MRGIAIPDCILSFIFVIALTTVSPCMASDQAVSAKDLTYITEQFPPFNFQVNGRPARHLGRSARAGLAENGEDLNKSVIQVLPWAEGYRKTLTEKKYGTIYCRPDPGKRASLQVGPDRSDPAGM